MKINYAQKILVSAMLFSQSAFSQHFTWKKGSTNINQSGIYGNIGSAAPLNNPGGRSGSASWKDGNSNFYLFGGDGFDNINNNGYLNDLWKYEPSSGQWTWLKGDNIIAQLGNYGTLGVAAATNKPGARVHAISWKDLNGNFWLFGGYGYDGVITLGHLNDLWKYNVSTNEWTWIGGSNLADATAIYGSQGVPSSLNTPGSRMGAASWTDNNGNLWMFGGYGNTSTTSNGHLNDLWRYNIATNEWTWMKGGNGIDQNATYGSIGVSAPSNNPGSRVTATSWVDNSGDFWMMGGKGYDGITPVSSYLNDLWKYELTTNEWTWIKGSNTILQNGTYGAQGVANSANTPGARLGANGWVDAANHIWLFGGEGLPATGVLTGRLNDLWKYEITSNQWTWIKNASLLNQGGSYGVVNTASITNRPGARSNAASWIDNADNLWLFGGTGFPANGGIGKLDDLWTYKNCFVSPISMTIVALDSVLCAGESTSLTVTGSNNYVWTHNSSTLTSVVITPPSSTTYSVNTLNANGCVYTSTFAHTVLSCVSVHQKNNSNELVHVFPNPSDGSFYINIPATTEPVILILKNTLGQVIYYKELDQTRNQIESGLLPGIYFYDVFVGMRSIANGKMYID